MFVNDCEVSMGILKCKKCSYCEDITSAVLRTIVEFKLLFPESKMTTNIVHDWCKIIQSRKTIRKILSDNFQLNRKGKSSYYE